MRVGGRGCRRSLRVGARSSRLVRGRRRDADAARRGRSRGRTVPGEYRAADHRPHRQSFRHTYTADYEVSGDAFSITALVSTERVCDPPHMTQEHAYLEALGSVERWKVAERDRHSGSDVRARLSVLGHLWRSCATGFTGSPDGRSLHEMFDLMWFAWLVGAMIGAIALRRRTPPVALGLLGAIVGGAVGFAGADGRSVPEQIAEYATLGLLLGCVLGSFVRPTATVGFLLWGAAVTAFVAAPVAGAITWNAMRERCTSYDPAPDRFCTGTDMFYGISGVVLGCVIVGAVIVTGAFLFGAWRAYRASRLVEAGVA